MRLISCGAAALAATALAACNSQTPAREPKARLLPATTAAPAPAKAVEASTASKEPLDSLRAFLGVRPMQFRYVPDSVRQGTPTVAGRYIVMHELFQTPRILYRSATDSTRWFQFKLEPVGEAGTIGGDFTVDTVGLDPRRQTLLLSLHGHNDFWGGSLSYSQMALVDVTAEPLLLLKTETLREDVSYGRDSDTVYNDSAAGSESQSQEISIRNHCMVVGPPRQASRQGRTSKLVASIIRLTPKTMVPAGVYRYQNGKILLVKKQALVRSQHKSG